MPTSHAVELPTSTKTESPFWDMARGEQLIGPDGYREDYERWLRAFPDGVCEVTRIVEQGEWAVVEFLNRGTNTGPLSNAAGSFPATGRRAEIAYCSVMRIPDGKVIFGRDYYDSGAILRQLALVPDSSPAGGRRGWTLAPDRDDGTGAEAG